MAQDADRAAADSAQAERPEPPAQAQAEDPAAKGLAIATAADESNLGFENTIVRARMTLRNRSGDESMREMRFFTLENNKEGEGDKTLVVVDAPADVDGTILLTHSKILAPDDQWIFLPALNRPKRISSVNKSGPFMGSEFAYEDMGAQDVEKYSYRWLRDEPCPAYKSFTCAVVERIPLYEHSAYTRQIIWIDYDAWRNHRIEYYDRKDSLLKTLDFSRYGQYEDQFWRSHQMHMVNHQTGKETTILTSRYQFGANIDERLFERENLDRIQ